MEVLILVGLNHKMKLEKNGCSKLNYQIVINKDLGEKKIEIRLELMNGFKSLKVNFYDIIVSSNNCAVK